jgi:hypothetical protein
VLDEDPADSGDLLPGLDDPLMPSPSSGIAMTCSEPAVIA